MHEVTLLQKAVEHWHWIVGVGSTIIAVFAYFRRKVKQHYENPLMRKNDMRDCKDDLCLSISENKTAIDQVEQKIEDEFVKHNAADRKRYENLLFAIGGMQNGRKGS